MRYRRANYQGAVASQTEAVDKLAKPGDMVLVDRGGPRSVVMKCPDGCGEVLTVNLDRRVGKAWRFYMRKDGISLYPSVWRSTGCRSHFVVWENGIFWNDGADLGRVAWEWDELRDKVLSGLNTEQFRSVEDLGNDLGEVPWAVASVCRRLTSERLIEEGDQGFEGWFRRLPTSPEHRRAQT